MAHVQATGEKKHLNAGGETEANGATFHDFLGDKVQGTASTAAGCGRPPPEVSPSPTSGLGSERNTGNHSERIQHYGAKGGNPSGPESSNRFSCYKRTNSDLFMNSARDNFPPGLQPDSQDSPCLNKMLRYSGEEIPRLPCDGETPYGMMNQTRLITPPYMFQMDTNPSKWYPGTTLQYPPRGGPLGYHQGPSSRAREANVGPPAADEGSRTGIKASIRAAGSMCRRQPSGVLIWSGKHISDPEPSTIPGQHGTESGGRQMTIFYNGQAHVFDNVHPNKADVIMALAGSNGESWSATYNKPDSTGKPSTNATLAPLGELHARSSNTTFEQKKQEEEEIREKDRVRGSTR